MISASNELYGGKLAKLTYLSLADNSMSSVEDGVFTGLTSLLTLQLQGNRLTAVDSGLFKGLLMLSYLDLSENLLFSLDEDLFKDLKNLKHLRLDYNSIYYIPSNLFSELKALTFLKINNGVGDNALTDIGPKAFPAISPDFIKLQLGKSFSCKARSDYRNLLKFTDDFCTLVPGVVQSFKTFLKNNSGEGEGLTPGSRGQQSGGDERSTPGARDQSGEGEISNAGVAVPICVQVGVLALCLLVSLLGLC
jgi:hypothetical protein